MTGFGEARRQAGDVSVAIEVRTINSRYFKLAFRGPDGYSSLEPEIEQIVRQAIKRGTIQVSLRVDRPGPAEGVRINTAVLESYRRQLDAVRDDWRWDGPLPLASVLLLPGVVDESSARAPHEEDWPLIAETLAAAMQNLAAMRTEEGRTMAADLKMNAAAIAAELDAIQRRAPLVGEGYRGRLEERIKTLLADYNISLQPGDLIREVGIFSERSNISEEIVRLSSHLDQFDTIIALEESSGRKLEFVIQEMSREINTIGSKANDVQISRHAIEIKAAIEKIREMIQNVE